jgi:hypothetical protein
MRKILCLFLALLALPAWGVWKNVASQKVAVYAYDTSGGAPKTGDAANITAQVSKDGGACAASSDTNPTELDSTNAPGVYLFDLTAAETNCDLLVLSADSATADVVIEPVLAYTAIQQTGDAFARLGAPAGASIAADVAALPTATEVQDLLDASSIDEATFNARTLLAEDYVIVSDLASVWDVALAGHVTAGTTGAKLNSTSASFPAGAIAYTYTVTDGGSGLPIAGVDVWASTDSGGTNIVWRGTTDTFGVARSNADELPQLDAGTYYFWRQLAGYDFPDPDTEVVSP